MRRFCTSVAGCFSVLLAGAQSNGSSTPSPSESAAGRTVKILDTFGKTTEGFVTFTLTRREVVAPVTLTVTLHLS